MKYLICFFVIFFLGCDSRENNPIIKGELAPNIRDLVGKPLEDVWEKVYQTSSHEIWVDSTNHVVVFIKNGYAELVYSDIDGMQFVDHYFNEEHLLTSEVSDTKKRLIVYKKEADGNVWWYVDKEYDGEPNVKLVPGKEDSALKLKTIEVSSGVETSSNSMQPTANASAD
jgi:hypothetical protein